MFHKHRWLVTNCKNDYEFDGDDLVPISLVFFVCSCGKDKRKTVFPRTTFGELESAGYEVWKP